MLGAVLRFPSSVWVGIDYNTIYFYIDNRPDDVRLKLEMLYSGNKLYCIEIVHCDRSVTIACPKHFWINSCAEKYHSGRTPAAPRQVWTVCYSWYPPILCMGHDNNIIVIGNYAQNTSLLAPLEFGLSPQPSTKEDTPAIYYRFNSQAT